jgi:hypothetical protein
MKSEEKKSVNNRKNVLVFNPKGGAAKTTTIVPQIVKTTFYKI